MEDADLVSINDKLVSFSLNLTMEAAVGGVILEHVDLRDGETFCKNHTSHKSQITAERKPIRMFPL